MRGVGRLKIYKLDVCRDLVAFYVPQGYCRRSKKSQRNKKRFDEASTLTSCAIRYEGAEKGQHCQRRGAVVTSPGYDRGTCQQVDM